MKTMLQHVMGCRLNHAEAERVRAAFALAGWRVLGGSSPSESATASQVDVFHLHTCAVTARAQSEAVRRVRAAKRAGAGRIVVSGCVANLPAAAAPLRAAGATDVVSRLDAPPQVGANEGGVDDPASIVRMALLATSQTIVPPAPDALRAMRTPVKIQDGCDVRCSYCIVPDARGAPRSLPLPDILSACRAAVSSGPREIVLTGVNTARWRDGSLTLPDAARAVAALPGVLRVRVASVEPDSAVPGIVELMTESEGRVCPTLHLPLQSGSDRILRAMRRRYTATEYRETVLQAVKRLPHLGLGTDVIVGFPGETEDDFALTLALVEELPFSNVHVFPYSERPGTPAASMPGAVPPSERRRRAKALSDAAARKRELFAAGFVGRDVEILAEAASAGGGVSGWSGEYLRATVRDAPASAIGTLVRARVVSADGDALLCQLRRDACQNARPVVSSVAP